MMAKFVKLSPIALVLLCGSQTISPRVISWDDYFQELQEEQSRFFRKMAALNESLWNDRDVLLSHKQSKSELVALPETDVKEEGDTLSIQVKNLKLKKEDIKIELDRDNNLVTVSFPHAESHVSLTVYSRALDIEVEKKITHEKKDEAGKVIASSSSMAYNSSARSLPTIINLDSAKAELKDGTLVLSFQKRETKRAISVK